MFYTLKERVFSANLLLKEYNLIVLTWGNVSEIDREQNAVAIKPSGVEYSDLKISDIVVTDLNGKVLEGELNPSVDLPTHLELYRKYKAIRGITHTHSTFATSFAQAGREIPALGTTHADHFYGSIKCTRCLTEAEVKKDYEINTAKAIMEKIGDEAMEVPAILCRNHGVFTFGKSAAESVKNALILEETAKMAYLTFELNKKARHIDRYVLDTHYNRKHGENATYGQKK